MRYSFILAACNALLLAGCAKPRIPQTLESDGSAESIQGLHDDQAVDGDTIMLPAGSHTWSQSLTITKNITLKGAGDKTTDNTNVTVAGPIMMWTLQDVDFTARLTGIHFHQTVQTGSNSGWITISGVSRLHSSGGNVVGGIRIDNIHLTASTSTVANSYYLRVNGLVDGVFDHNFLDFDKTWVSAENFDIGRKVQPDGTGIRGQYSWFEPYIFGGSPLTDAQGFYFEDNVIHKPGAWMDDLTANGGGRLIVRYNNTWGHVGGHNSTRAREIYNNHFVFPSGGTTFSFAAITNRGGSAYEFNNYMTAWPGGNNALISGPGFERISGAGSIGPCSVGASDGTSAVDQNSIGTITINGHSYSPVASPAPHPPGSLIGDIYANGTGVTSQGVRTFLLTGLASTFPNQWQGFTLRNTNSAPAESSGGTTGQNNYYGIISSSVASGTDTVVTILNSGSNQQLTWTSDQQGWEIRHINRSLLVVGSGKMSKQLTGNPFMVAYTTPPPTPVPNPQWLDQEKIGIWQWSNKWRPDSAASFTPVPGIHGMQGGAATLITAGGLNDETPPTVQNGALWDYPGCSSCPNRVGADWNPAGYSETLTDNTLVNYGAPYPHPLVGAPSPVPTPNPTPGASSTVAPSPSSSPTQTATATVTPSGTAMPSPTPALPIVTIAISAPPNVTVHVILPASSASPSASGSP